MDFRQAFNTVNAELTPQPWDYTAPDGTTLTVIPACQREARGYAEVTLRIDPPCACSRPKGWHTEQPSAPGAPWHPYTVRSGRHERGCLVVGDPHDAALCAGLWGRTDPAPAHAAEVGVTTTYMVSLLHAIEQRVIWEHETSVGAMLDVATEHDGALFLAVTEVHDDPRRKVVATVYLPEAQRQPLASALRRATDVARGWED